MNLIQEDWWAIPETHAPEPLPDSRRLRRLGYAIGAGIVLVLGAMAVAWWVGNS